MGARYVNLEKHGRKNSTPRPRGGENMDHVADLVLEVEEAHVTATNYKKAWDAEKVMNKTLHKLIIVRDKTIAKQANLITWLHIIMGGVLLYLIGFTIIISRGY